MNTADVADTLDMLFGELAGGAPEGGAFILNPGDAGLLGSLDVLDAEQASASIHGGATVAAHADHMAYALSLLNRWAAGENPFHDSDWSVAWRRTTVTETEWAEIRRMLRGQVEQWRTALRTPRDVQPIELNGMIASIAHLAYHLGAIRQIQPAAKGPPHGG